VKDRSISGFGASHLEEARNREDSRTSQVKKSAKKNSRLVLQRRKETPDLAKETAG